MSLAMDLTGNQQRLAQAEREASALLRRHRAVIPPEIYTGLQLHLIVIASETTKLKINLGAMRMTGDLEQLPPAVKAENLEMASGVPLDPGMVVLPLPQECRSFGAERLVPMVPEHLIRDESAAFQRELEHIGDDTLREGAR